MPERTPPPAPEPKGIDGSRKRDAEIRAMWSSARWTLSAIARKFRLSDSRVWQIVHRRKPPSPGDSP